MAVESKPLFHPEVIRQQVRSFQLPERVAELSPRLRHWADLIASGRADDFKESDLLPDFITDQYAYEHFETVRLAADPKLLERFVFLLGAERVTPAKRDCHLYELLKASESVGRELTNRFYALYADIRQKVLTRLCRENAAIAPPEILRCTQKLLDRVLFCAFCEDRGLLPEESLKRTFTHHDPYNPKPIWDNFRGLFRAIDAGNAGLNIPAYNGGLFAPDPGLDALAVPDEVCAHFKDLGDYDYRPAREVADAEETTEVRSLIDVDILAHIFEQSITDLERLRQEMVKVRFEALRRQHEAEATGTATRALADPNAYDLTALNDPQRKALIRFWEAWQEVLKRLRLLDPACGSGAFLIEAFDQLHAQLNEWTKPALIALVKDLYDHAADNRDFLAARFQADEDGGAALEKYRSKIIEQFFPRHGFGKLKLGEARMAIRDYRKATGNLAGTLELMMTYVENGTRFTRDYRCDDEGFYNSMDSVLAELAGLLIKEGPELYTRFRTG